MKESSTVIRHPWDKWFSGARFKITKGKDFHCMVHGMIQQIRNYASRNSLSVSIKTEPPGTIFVEIVE